MSRRTNYTLKECANIACGNYDPSKDNNCKRLQGKVAQECWAFIEPKKLKKIKSEQTFNRNMAL
jgi:hypothetical protein